jgi:hypothetical protein
VLLHQYLDDPEYADFYDKQSRFGDFVILDNSAYELGSSGASAGLLAVAETLHPKAIFLPDVRFNSKETLKQTAEAIPLLRATGALLLGVPQGNSLSEVSHCYDQLVALGVDGFGLYEEIGVVTGLGRRWDFLQYLEDSGRVFGDKYYHLLGMEEDIHNIAKLAEFQWANSIDSAKPIVYGLYGMELDPEHGSTEAYPHRPKDFFGRTGEGFHSTILRDCLQTINWAKFGLSNNAAQKQNSVDKRL